MIDLRELDQFRVPLPDVFKMVPDYDRSRNGAFVIYRQQVVGVRYSVRSPIVPTTTAAALRIIAANGGGWDHVSVSLVDRCPTWDEMEHVKRLFFKPDETAMQLHVPPSDHINRHPYVLHLWRPHRCAIPMPPKNYV